PEPVVVSSKGSASRPSSVESPAKAQRRCVGGRISRASWEPSHRCEGTIEQDRAVTNERHVDFVEGNVEGRGCGEDQLRGIQKRVIARGVRIFAFVLETVVPGGDLRGRPTGGWIDPVRIRRGGLRLAVRRVPPDRVAPSRADHEIDGRRDGGG